MLYKAVIFTNSPLLEAYRYRNKFQLVPLSCAPNAPFSVYAHHFPAFLEFEADGEEESMTIDDVLRSKSIPEDVVKFGHTIPTQLRVKREILHLLSSLTNFHFFEYNSSMNGWGIQVPDRNVSELTAEESSAINNQTSHWTIRGYLYPGLKDFLKIDRFSDCTSYIINVVDERVYFTDNPNIENNSKISFPPHIDFCLDQYYAMPCDLCKQIRHCIGLLADGIELFDYKRSVSLLAIVSSIEGMANIDYRLYGRTPGLRVLARFTRYLKLYVAGGSEDKYKAYYSKRCDISHDGIIFLGDDDLYGDMTELHKDWLLRLEIMQVARFALYNWLRRKK